MRYLKIFLLCLTWSALVIADDVYQDQKDFINEVFVGKPPKLRLLSLTDSARKEIKAILGRDLGVTRLRYWGEDGRTVQSTGRTYLL